MSSRLQAVLAAGDTAYGAFLMLRSDPVAVEIIAKQGFDYLCIDMQHGLADFDTTVGLLQAITHGDATPLVRVPSLDDAVIGHVLDAGAQGVIVPMINSADEARAAVRACRYAPDGTRSFGPLRAGSLYPGYYPDVAASVLCIPMIETADALRDVDDIVAVPGVAAVYLGPSDLSLALGLPPANDSPDTAFVEALDTVVAACDRAGVTPAVHANAGLAAARRATGFRMITVATDMSALVAGTAGDLARARGPA